MKASKLYFLIALCGLLAGCGGVRAISNSSYREDEGLHIAGYFPRANDSDPGFAYRGELSEFDVLGIERGEAASDLEIQKALDNAKSVKLSASSSILLIQSGAMFPDAPMVKELSRYFRVSPFSGVPPTSRHGTTIETRDPESFAQSLRLAAARGGNDVVLCYWGILESEKQDLATKSVSWIPTVGWVMPDEKQHMRIRLKLALIDVRSGNWTVLSPEAFDDARMSTSLGRAAKDQKQVELLKAKAYEASVKDLVDRFLPHPVAAR
jgi:hypothetical protein